MSKSKSPPTGPATEVPVAPGDGDAGAWRAQLPAEVGRGPLGAALSAAGFRVDVDADPAPGAVILNGAALGAASPGADPGEADALLALVLGAQAAVRRLPGGGRVINVVRAGGPAQAGALALGRALREELRPAVAVTTLVVGEGAPPEHVARVAALAAACPGPGGLDEAVLSA